MPRYFFDVSNGTHNVDNEGTVLTDSVEARRQGIVTAAAMFGEEANEVAPVPGESWTMRISDEARAVVCTIRFTIHDGLQAPNPS